MVVVDAGISLHSVLRIRHCFVNKTELRAMSHSAGCFIALHMESFIKPSSLRAIGDIAADTGKQATETVPACEAPFLSAFCGIL